LDFSPQFMNPFDSRKEAVFKTGQPVTGETYFMTVDGVRNYEYIISPVYDDSGGIKYVVSTFRDITERAIAEEDIREQRDKASIPGYRGSDTACPGSHRYCYADKQEGMRTARLCEHEIVGKNWFDNFVPETDRVETSRLLKR